MITANSATNSAATRYELLSNAGGWSMDRESFAGMLDRMARAWTSRDYDRVIDEFANELFYCDPVNYTFRDRSSLLAFFEDDDDMPQSCFFHNSVFDEAEQTGCAEYTYKGTYVYHGTVWITLEF